MSGHGHVFPNPDGSRARCGGPGICMECSLEADQEKLYDTGAEERPTPTDKAQALAEEWATKKWKAKVLNSTGERLAGELGFQEGFRARDEEVRELAEALNSIHSLPIGAFDMSKTKYNEMAARQSFKIASEALTRAAALAGEKK